MINIDFLRDAYFWADEPVKYPLDKKEYINIYPVSLKESVAFLQSIDILCVDKNALSDAKFISMSYLEFLITVLLPDKENAATQKLINILFLCLHWTYPNIIYENNRYCLYDKEQKITLKPKQFEDIRRIILYQNLIHYDDSYINPEARQAMAEVDALKNQNRDIPNMERKIAIITAHTGVTKKQQMEMTLRSHSVLFEEVSGEVDFLTTHPVALIGNMFSDKKNHKEIDHWVYPLKKNKFDGYFTSDTEYHQQMGGDGKIKQVGSSNEIESLQNINLNNIFNS